MAGTGGEAGFFGEDFAEGAAEEGEADDGGVDASEGAHGDERGHLADAIDAEESDGLVDGADLMSESE